MPSAGSVFVSLGLDLRNLVQGAQKATQALKSIEDFSSKLSIKGPDAGKLEEIKSILNDTTFIYKELVKVVESAATKTTESFTKMRNNISNVNVIIEESSAKHKELSNTINNITDRLGKAEGWKRWQDAMQRNSTTFQTLTKEAKNYQSLMNVIVNDILAKASTRKGFLAAPEGAQELELLRQIHQLLMTNTESMNALDAATAKWTSKSQPAKAMIDSLREHSTALRSNNAEIKNLVGSYVELQSSSQQLSSLLRGQISGEKERVTTISATIDAYNKAKAAIESTSKSSSLYAERTRVMVDAEQRLLAIARSKIDQDKERGTHLAQLVKHYVDNSQVIQGLSKGTLEYATAVEGLANAEKGIITDLQKHAQAEKTKETSLLNSLAAYDKQRQVLAAQREGTRAYQKELIELQAREAAVVAAFKEHSAVLTNLKQNQLSNVALLKEEQAARERTKTVYIDTIKLQEILGSSYKVLNEQVAIFKTKQAEALSGHPARVAEAETAQESLRRTLARTFTELENLRKTASAELRIPDLSVENWEKGFNQIKRRLNEVNKERERLYTEMSRPLTLDLRVPALREVERMGQSLQAILKTITQPVDSFVNDLQRAENQLVEMFETMKAGGESIEGIDLGGVKGLASGYEEQQKRSLNITEKILSEVQQIDEASARMNMSKLVTSSSEARNLMGSIASEIGKISDEGVYKVAAGWKQVNTALQEVDVLYKEVSASQGELTAEQIQRFQDVVNKYRTGITSINQGLGTVQDRGIEVVQGLQKQKLDFTKIINPDALRQQLAQPFANTEQLVNTLQNRLQQLASSRYVTPEARRELQVQIQELEKYRDVINRTRTAIQAANIDRLMDDQFGQEIITRIQETGISLDDLVGRIELLDRKLSVTDFSRKISFKGTQEELIKLIEGFRTAADSIGSRWEQAGRSIQATTKVIVDGLKQFTQATQEIPDVGAPGVEVYARAVQDMERMKNEVDANAKALINFRQELELVGSQTPDKWARNRVQALTQERAAVDKNSTAYTSLTREITELLDPAKTQRLYTERINRLNTEVTATRRALNEQYAEYRKYVANVEHAYRELALSAARQLTQQLEVKPIQIGAEVTEFQQEAYIQRAQTVQKLRNELEKLNAQETLNIQTDQSRRAQLERLNQIVAQAVPLQREHVEEMVRLALSVDNVKAKFGAVSSVIQKLSQISVGRALLGEQFKTATEYMTIFEQKSRDVANLLSAIGVGFDESSALIIASMNNINRVITEETGEVLGLRAVYDNLGLAIKEVNSLGNVTVDTYRALLTSIDALSPKLRQQVIDFGQIGASKGPAEAFEKMQSGAAKLINEGLEPVISKVKQMTAETERELKISQEMEKAAASAAKLKERIEVLTETHSRGAATLDSLTEKFQAYQRLQRSGEGLSNRQILDMQRIGSAIQVMSQNIKGATDLQKRLVTARGDIETLGGGYEIAGSKLAVYKQTVDSLLSSFTTLHLISQQELDDLKNRQQQYVGEQATLKNLENTYNRVVAVKRELSEASTRGVALESPELAGTIQQFESLKPIVEQMAGGLGQLAYQTDNLEVKNAALDATENKLAASLTRTRERMHELGVTMNKVAGEDTQLVTQLLQQQATLDKLQQSYININTVLNTLKVAQREGIGLQTPEMEDTLQQIERLRTIVKDLTGATIIDPRQLGLEQLIEIFATADVEVRKHVDQLTTSIGKLRQEGTIKLAASEELLKSAEEVEKLKDRLRVLTEVQNRSGLSLQTLTEKYKIYQDLQAKGISLNSIQQKDMQETAGIIDLLSAKFTSLTDLQKQLQATVSTEEIGKEYTAATNRLKIYEKEVSNLMNTLAQLSGRTATQTASEKQFQAAFSESSVRAQQLQTTLRQLETVRALLERQKKLKIVGEDDIIKVQTAVEKLNRAMQQVGLQPIRVNTKDLNRLLQELDRVGAEAKGKMKQTVTNLQSELENFRVQFKVEGLETKQQEELRKVKEDLRVLGEQEKQNIEVKKAHTERIQAMQKALQLTAHPQQQALQFLSDEREVRRQNVEQLTREIRQRPLDTSLVMRRTIEQNKLNTATKLYARVSQSATANDAARTKVFKDLNKYTEQAAEAAGKASGRYTGLAQAVGGLVSDMKNLIRVQIRWYATQFAIFQTVQGLRDTIAFYIDLESQVSRVTSVLSQEYDLLGKTERIMGLVRKEMSRTGETAENLTTTLWELVSAGISHNEAMAGLEHVTNLSIAAELDLSETTRITAGLFRVFGEQIENASTASDKFRVIVDSLAATLNQSQVDMNGLIAGLGYLINESDAVGLSMNQVLGVLSVLNNRLLLGSKAGRASSRVLTQLTANADKLAEAFNLKIDFTKPLDLIDILTQLNIKINESKVNGQITVETFSKLQDVFGQIGKRAAVGLIENVDELKNTIAELETGKFEDLTEQMAQVKLGTLEREIKRLSNAFKLFLSDVLDPIVSSLEIIVELGLAMTERLSVGLEGIQQQSYYTYLKLGAVAGVLQIIAHIFVGKGWISAASVFQLLGFAAVSAAQGLFRLLINLTLIIPLFKSLRGIIVGFITLLRTFSITTALAASGFTGFALLLSVVGVAVIALGTAYYRWAEAAKRTREELKKANEEVIKSKQAYDDAINQVEAIRNNMEDLAKQYENAIPYTREWYNLRDRINRQYPGLLRDMETEIVTMGKAEDAITKRIALERERLQLDLKRRNLESAYEVQMEAAEKRAEQLAQKLFSLTQGQFREGFLGNILGVADKVKYKRAMGELNAEVERLNKAIEDFGARNVEVGPKVRFLIETFTGFDPQIDTILKMSRSLELMGESGVLVSENMVALKEDIDELTQGRTAAVQFELGKVIDKEAVLETVKTLREEALKLVSESFEQTDIYERQIQQFRNFQILFAGGMERLKDDVVATNVEVASKIVYEWSEDLAELGRQVPQTLKTQLAGIGIDIDETLQTAITNAVDLAKTHARETDRVKEAITELSNAAENVEANISMMLGGVFQGTVRQLDRILKDYGSPQMSGLREAIVAQVVRLSAQQQQILKTALGNQYEAFKTWLQEGGELSIEQFRLVSKGVEEIVKVLDSGLADLNKRQLENLAAALRVSDKIQESAYSVQGIIDALGRGATKVVSNYLEQNERLLSDTAEYLPEYVRDMISKATDYEKLELIKLINETNNEISEEARKLGVALTPELKSQLAIKKYQEMYEELSTISGKFYEESLEQGAEFIDEMIKRNEKLDRSTATLSKNILKYKKQEYDITKKYQEEELLLQARINAAKRSSFSADDENQYKRISARVAEYREEIEKTAKAMEIASNTLDKIRVSQERFDEALFDAAAQDSLASLLNKYTTELAIFLDERDEDVKGAFQQLTVNVADQMGQNESHFLLRLQQELMRVLELNVEDATVLIGDLLLVLQEKGIEGFLGAIQNLDILMGQLLETARSRQAVARAQLLAGNEQLSKITEKYQGDALRNNREYQRLVLQREALQLQKERELLQAREEMYNEHYEILANQRENELDRIDEFESTFERILSGSELRDNLRRRLAIFTEGFELEAEELNKQIAHRKKTLDGYVNYRKKIQKQISDIVSAGEENINLTGPEAARVDRLTRDLEQTKDAAERIKDTILDLDRERNLALEQEDTARLKQIEKATAKTLEEEEGLAEGIRILEERIAEARKLGTDKRIAELERERLSIDEHVKALRVNLVAMVQQLETLPEAARIKFAQTGKEAAENIADKAQEFLDSNILELAASLRIRGAGAEAFNLVDTIVMAEEMGASLREVTDLVMDDWTDYLQNELKKGNINVDEQFEWMDQMQLLLDSMVTDSTTGIGEKIQEEIIKELSTIDITTEAAQPLFTIDPDLLLRAGFSLEKHREILGGIRNIERARGETGKEVAQDLQDQVIALERQRDAQRELLREKIDELTVAENNLEKAKELEKSAGEIEAAQREVKFAELAVLAARARSLDIENGIARTIEEIINLAKKLEEQEKRLLNVTLENKESWGEFFDALKYGARTAFEDFADEAMNASQYAASLIEGIMSGLVSTIQETIGAIFFPPEEEIQAAEQTLDDLLQQRKSVEEEMKLLEVGGVASDEVERYQALQQQWKEISNEIGNARKELDQLSDTNARVTESFKKFGREVFDIIAELTLRMTIAYFISKALAGIFSLFGGPNVSGVQADLGPGFDISNIAEGTFWGGSGLPWGSGGIMTGGFTPLQKFAKGGIVQGGFRLPEKGRQNWLDFVKYSMGATLYQSGGVATSPTLGLVGEAGQNEAVVPLPDNRSIPVKFEGEPKTSDVKIMNIVDPAMIPSVMLENPDIIVNVISDDIQKRGPLFHLIKQVNPS